jgi:hypothetical protein
MAAATPTAMYSQNSTQQGLTLATAFPQVNGYAENLDLFQIISKKGGAVLLNVDYLGGVHNPAVNPTSSSASGVDNTRIGQFATDFQSSDNATTAQLFQNAFANPSLLDIFQAVNLGMNVHYYIDYLGVSHGS